MSDSPAANLPLFYRNPVPVEPSRHANWKIRQNRRFSFASKTNAIPVVIEEFPVLQSHYPIVFSTSDRPAALALVGLRPQENLFLAADGSWLPGSPIPAYVRRYPFIMMETPNRERLVLCMEEDAAAVGVDGDIPLFEGDGPAQGGKDALEFCANFNNAAQMTQAMCEEIKKAGLLVEQRADFVTPDKQRVSLSGFTVIDEEKFAKIPDELFLEWRRRNWIGLIYCHLMSLGRWNALVDRTIGQTA